MRISSMVPVPTEVRQLIAKRQGLREAKRWAEADEIREEITKLGYTVDEDRGGVWVDSIPLTREEQDARMMAARAARAANR